MKIKIIKCLQDNYSYVIIDENNQSACIVDPSESEPIIDFIDNNKIDLKYILNTHHHHDHIGGNLELKKKYNCDVIGFKDDKDRIPGINILVENNQIWQKGNFEAKIYHTPGHTSGHIAFHFFKEKIIFTGDTLFSLGCGRIFEGTYEQMFNSLKITSCRIIKNDDASVSFTRAIKNIPNSVVISELGANVYDILKHKKLIITEAAIKKLEERLT